MVSESPCCRCQTVDVKYKCRRTTRTAATFRRTLLTGTLFGLVLAIECSRPTLAFVMPTKYSILGQPLWYGRSRFTLPALAEPKIGSDESSQQSSSDFNNTSDLNNTSLHNVSSLHTKETPNSSTSDWTASSTFGSFLLKRQREEVEEIRRLGLNETELEVSAEMEAALKPLTPPSPPSPPAVTLDMDREAVKEVDEAVTWLKGPPESFTKDIKVLPLSSMYAALQSSASVPVSEQPQETVIEKKRFLERLRLFRRPAKQSRQEKSVKIQEMPLSMPEHYSDRIGRDIRQLAVSIASNVQDPWQWRLFVEEKGGIVPLLQCIQEGARFVREKKFDFYEESEFLGFVQEYEELLMVACAACRALRDLAALSDSHSAVVTDDILRVNKASFSSRSDATAAADGVMSDLVTLLSHATDVERIYKRIYKRRGRLRPKDKAAARFIFKRSGRKKRREARRRCKLYVLQLLLSMAIASDDAVKTMRETPGLTDAVLACSSYARKEQTRRWLRYPVELVKNAFRSGGAAKLEDESEGKIRPFVAAASVRDDLSGKVQGTANQVLAVVGYNQWVPKIPGQKGLRILCLDGGGSRGIVAVTTLVKLVDSMGGVEVCDSFDIICGTSTGAIIAFLVGLRRESTRKAMDRYNELIKRIFVKSPLRTPLLLFTTASYDEAHFTRVMNDVLGDYSMLDSRENPAVPLVCAVSSKMSSTPTHVALFRNYNYAEGEFPDTFVIDPDEARMELGLPREKIPNESELISTKATRSREPSMPGVRQGEGSRHPGSFRVLQRVALRASTAAPTVFKPVSMGGEMYCDGGIVASNPAAVAMHEARAVFPGVPIEMVVSCGTGGFLEERNNPRFGWDGIIGQIVNSATDAEQVHHILEDVLGEGGTAQLGQTSISKTRYFRLNPIIGAPNDFPIDVTDPKLLDELKSITERYLEEPEQQRKLQEIGDILEGRSLWKGVLP